MTNSINSSITIDTNGDWHIVYPDRDRNEDGFDTRYIKYKNKSSTETLAEGYGNIFSGDGEGVGHPSIAIDPNGDLHVTYIYLSYDELENQIIMYTAKEAGHSSWSTAQKITTFDYSFKPSYSSIAADSDGDWHIVYPDLVGYEDNSDRRYIKYKNKGSTEILAEEYGNIWSGTGEGVGYPSIAIGQNGDLHVIYTHIKYIDTFNQSIMYTTRGIPDKSSSGMGTDQKDSSIFDNWWILLIIIVVIVILIAGILLRKKPSPLPKHGTSDITEGTVGQTITERKYLPPPPPRPKSPLPPPPP
jgi:hypothetical protein